MPNFATKNKKAMFVVIGILILFVTTLWVGTYLNRRNQEEEVEIKQVDSECCGAHEVCEKETLLNSTNKITYYDDEELDTLAGIDPQNFSKEQLKLLSDVFYTLKESDVAGWLRSLQMRRIALPEDLIEEALLIVRERRGIV